MDNLAHLRSAAVGLLGPVKKAQIGTTDIAREIWMKGVMKASIVIGALAPFAASAQAASIPGGPYVGIVGGYQSTNVEHPESAGGNALRLDTAIAGPRVGVIGGWGAWSNNIYGALELNAATSTADGNSSLNSAKLKLESEETYGASVLFGTRVVPGTVLYGRAGWQRVKASAKINGESDSQWFSGVRAGAGGMWALSDAVAFRLEYTHSFYRSEEWDDLNGATLKVEPHENLFQAGFTVGF